MSRTGKISMRKRRHKTVPILGAAGLSLTLASGASVASPTPSLDPMTRDVAQNSEIILREEEIFDPSLATFHVFDNETARPFRTGIAFGGACCQFACLGGQSSSGSESPPALGSDAYSRPPRSIRPAHKRVEETPRKPRRQQR
jgi:hypothetical protein